MFGSRSIDLLDIFMLPMVYFFRMADQPINLILKCITCFFFFSLSLGKEIYLWIKWITMHIVLLLLSGTRIAVHVGATSATISGTLLQASTFWAKNLLEPAWSSLKWSKYISNTVPMVMGAKQSQIQIQTS